ncbi:MAG: esterase [Rubrivivax sp.]|nr:esterase [Rubrivivax sp.]
MAPAAPAAGALGAAPPAAPTHLLYLHGFRSSPQSFKAQRMLAWLREHRPAVQAWCPQLPPSPDEAMALVHQGTAHWPAAHSAVVGSSLGGFYAMGLSAQKAWPAVLINPAVDPARDLAAYIGEQRAFHAPDEAFYFRPEYIEQLRRHTLPGLPGPLPAEITARWLAVIATGDEVLDWHEMHTRCQGAKMHIVQGSDHALSDFDQHLSVILHHLKLCD